jgi:adenylosuccinate synthase
MTRQEQIEEMKTLLLETYIEWLDMPATDKKPNLYDIDANKLYDAGYRKIPENAVVLTKEDLTKEPYNEFCKGCPNVRTRSSGITDCCADYNCRQFTRYANLIENYEQARKETAKEILLLLGKGYDETEKTEFNNLQWYKEFCRELKHRYGAEVEE